MEFSFGSLGSHMIATSFPLFTRCLSRQFSVIFNFPFTNQFTSGVLNSQSRTLSHFDFHEKVVAISAQNASGFSVLF